MMVSQYLGPGNWSTPKWFYHPGFIPWRTKAIDDVPYLIAYVGGENIYNFKPAPIEVHWLTTQDGINWEPVVPGKPVVLSGGCSETDFVFLDDGSLIAACRNEAGDELGWGSKICTASASDLGKWECVADPKKYDSLLMFRHNSDVYLIGRRNLTRTGNYDLGFDRLPKTMQTLIYQLHYWVNPKRCSLWKVDPDKLDVHFVLDFPSSGDTCFPGIVAQSDNSYFVYNYTSPVEQEDLSWVKGQLGPTMIYRILLKFPDHLSQ